MRLRLGTRGSRLAIVQARVVADLIRSKCPGFGVELVILKTSGDVRSEFGDEISNTVGELVLSSKKRSFQMTLMRPFIVQRIYPQRCPIL
jgi:porphobilinogen deaminase